MPCGSGTVFLMCARHRGANDGPMRLATRIALVCGAAVLPSLGMQAWHEVALRQSRIAEVRAEAQRFALLSAVQLDRVLDGGEQVLRSVAVTALHHNDSAECSAELAEVRRRLGRYSGLAYADGTGRIFCSSSGQTGIQIEDRPYFQAALATDRRVLGEYVHGRGSGRPTLPVVVGLDMPDRGRIVGIAALDLGWLSASLAGNLAMPEGGSLTVADRSGVILARTPLPERFVGTRIPDPFLHLLGHSQPGALEVVSQDGTSRVLGYVPVVNVPEGLYVSAGLSATAAYAAMDAATLRGGLLILVSLASALGAAWLFGRATLRQPLLRLLAAMQAWAGGDRTARAPADGGWEVGRLAAGFNAMADAVSAREEALAASEARLRALLEQLPVGVVLAEVPGGRVLFRNARAAELLQGGAPGEAGEGAAPLVEPLRQAVREGRATEDLELPLRRGDGSETVISVSAAPVRAPGGAPLAVAAFLDVGARRHAERQQALLTAELRHRVKNALAVVQAVAAQTLASSTSLEGFKESFGARLRDLARAQDALFAAADGRVRLGWLIRTALAPFAAQAVSAQGPEVALPAKQTLAMALVLHEMATNAAKHGALRPGGHGRLDVTWALRSLAGREEVMLLWQESRPGEAVAPPETGRGFGARLIARCVAHDLRGHAAWRVEEGALVWEIAFPAPLPEAAAEPEPELA
jgi:two-component sensor histidine kinase